MRLLVADDIRQEVNGKVSLIGLFPDNIVVAHPWSGSPEPSQDNPLGFEALSFMIVITGLQGRHEATLAFIDDSLPSPAPFQRQLEFSEHGAAHVLLRVRPYVTGRYGQKFLEVGIAGHKERLPFEVRRGGVVPQEAPGSQARRPARSKRSST